MAWLPILRLSLAVALFAEGFEDKCPSTASNQQMPVPNEKVEEYMNFARAGDGTPSIFHGILWMDQTGYYQTRPDRPDQAGEYETLPGQKEWFASFPHNLPGAAPELLVSFGGAWNETTQCAKVSRHASTWSFANTTASNPGTLAPAGGGFYQFCLDHETGAVEILQSICDYGEDIPKDFFQEWGRWLIPRPWGFERLNKAWAMIKEGKTVTVAQRYAVYQIIDGDGKRTPHYQAYSDFMKMRCWFTHNVSPILAPNSTDEVCASQGGFSVNLGSGTQVMYLPPV